MQNDRLISLKHSILSGEEYLSISKLYHPTIQSLVNVTQSEYFGHFEDFLAYCK